MKSFTRSFITFALFNLSRSSSTFKWPNPLLNYADRQLYEGPLNSVVLGCPSRDNSTLPAQWLRLAYHDMATHNVDDGTGGLDGSIRFELDRPQDIGQGMIDSLRDFTGGNDFVGQVQAPFFGMADIIALGAVLAVAGCGGPVVPFSAGRIDATEAGPATVPEPQQDLASHTESFRRQGFTPSEMIALVACGHTLGGVRQVDFPLVVTDNATVVQSFDSTPAFDTAVVSEYLQNTTRNILVVGPNVTTRSDFRIFSSDGNATMQSLLSPDTFDTTCASLLERMINTVPSNVKLTDPITQPFEYLVTDPMFAIRDGSLFMATALRVRHIIVTYILEQRADIFRKVLSSNPARTVTLFWTDRRGSSCPPNGCSAQPHFSQGVTFTVIGTKQGVTAQRFSFNATINSTASISKFWFEINENDGSEPITVDNSGTGFVIDQDSVFVDIGRIKSGFIGSPGVSGDVTELVVAIRGDSTSFSNASVSSFVPSSNGEPPFSPTIEVSNLELDTTNAPDGGYIFLTTNISTQTTFSDVTATLAGGAVTAKNFDVNAALRVISSAAFP
ncbi:hypothetical protein D9757_008674 [Collybiopsis confluens]|uniref:Peroxidase n=1 Tax=Collybiopsis confluens TaxID=2823264 RepID=A0A8H5H459_9AGAR|nr:hypothetical protein D9757_008674 [Collybiopsis confluens]